MKSYHRIKDLQRDLREGSVKLPDMVTYYLSNIEKRKSLNAFLEVFEEEVQSKAIEIQEKIEHDKAGKLAGLVIGIKDNICYEGHISSASSKILEGFESLYSATVVEKLLAEDAIIIGRLNHDEFAMGSSNENSAFGNVKNPYDESKVPGGSSGGSAAAVAADLCQAALGSDTGGSIRQPASFCGLVGLKPSYGRVSRHGLIAYASSFDQIGPLTKSVEDAALILEVIAGNDEFDSTASSKPVPQYSLKLNFEGKNPKIAVLSDCIEAEGLAPVIKDGILDLIEKLKERGIQFDMVDFPYLNEVVPVYQILSNAEASSNLSRYDGILYGKREGDSKNLEETLVESRTKGFGKEVKRRIMLGTFVLSEGYYEAYYSKAQKVRRMVRDYLENILEDYDFIILPSTPGPAFEIGKKLNDPIAMYLEDLFTVKAPIAGLPAISLPLKHTNSLPFGVQIISGKFEETKLLSFSHFLHTNFI